MSVFTSYPEVPEVDVAINEVAKKPALNRKIAKRLKKQNKILKRIVHSMEQQRSVEMAQVKKTSFFEDLGNATVKAVPAVLVATAPKVISALFQEKSK